VITFPPASATIFSAVLEAKSINILIELENFPFDKSLTD
jgi:hypothetical protein